MTRPYQHGVYGYIDGNRPVKPIKPAPLVTSVAFVRQADGSTMVKGVDFAEQVDGSILWGGAKFTKQADGSYLVI